MRLAVLPVSLALTLALVGAAPAPVPATFGPAVRKIVTASGAPGEQVLVLDHGHVAFSASYGVRNLNAKQPVDADTHFEIGSITKQFTAAAILQLKEQGKLALSDRLGKYVAGLPNAKNVTIEQMLWQVSGIPNYTDTKAFDALIAMRGGKLVLAKNGSFDAVLAMIAKKPLDFKPGTKWAYSNTNYVLLGHIVSLVSGMPWETYVRKQIFAPAGMTESAFMEDEAKIADMATGYTKYKGKLVPAGSFYGWARGAGAIVSTASDLAKWDVALFGGKIVKPADLKLMTAPGPLPSGPEKHYGFGWMIDAFDGQARVWHNGGTMGFLAQNDVYPALSQAVIVLQSFTGSSPATVADAAFDQLHPALAAAKLKPAAGEDPAVTARAKNVWQELLAGVVDHSQFDASMNKALTPAMLEQGTAQLKALGPPTAWTYAGDVKHGAMTAYMYRLGFSSGAQLTLVMAIDADGKIAGFAAH